jgi:hypothetical protein
MCVTVPPNTEFKSVWKTGNLQAVVRLLIAPHTITAKDRLPRKTPVFSAQEVWRIYCRQTPRLITNPLCDMAPHQLKLPEAAKSMTPQERRLEAGLDPQGGPLRMGPLPSAASNGLY